MRIEQIRIECELTQSTFGGGLNANSPGIASGTYVPIILPLTREPIPSLMCVKTEQRA